jgi:putative Mg2+ transporter-C (MgtC) family protein
MTSFEIQWYLFGRLLLASLLGALIGLERELHGRPAGFRTHLLVSLGSCLFVVTSIHFYTAFGNFSGTGPPGVDPGRIAAQVVTGIGFLGAGAILRERASVRGLTTAACLWVAAAIGLACGAGMYAISVFVTVLALASLLLLKKVEGLLVRDTYQNLRVWTADGAGQVEELETILRDCDMQLLNVTMEKDLQQGELMLDFQIKLNDRQPGCRIVERIAAVAGVKKVALS